jgi:hypothetical protein
MLSPKLRTIRWLRLKTLTHNLGGIAYMCDVIFGAIQC